MWAVVVALGLGACKPEPGAPTGAKAPPPASRTPASPHPTPSPKTAAADPEAPRESAPHDGLPSRFEIAPGTKIAALGDVHGDLQATRAALRLVGAIGADDHWTGGTMVLVQTGDQLDRGDDEQAIVDLLQRLTEEAKAAGGAVHVLNGNHEFMNVMGDLRYVTPGGFADFADVPDLDLSDPRLADVAPPMKARVAALSPGGPYAKILAQRNTVVVVGDTVFAHGGVLPKHVPDGVSSLDRLNADARAWLSDGKTGAQTMANDVMATDGVVWTRLYSDPSQGGGCEPLKAMLDKLGAKRLVVGHTVQADGVTSACDGKVWRIDVGMAAHYGGKPQAIVIEGDNVTVLGP